MASRGTWPVGSGSLKVEKLANLGDRPAPPASSVQKRALEWLRDHVSPAIPRLYYQAVLGHDLHLSLSARLYARKFHHAVHAGLCVPATRLVNGELVQQACSLGYWGERRLVSHGKVTVAWRNFVVAQMVAETAEIGDAKYHEVGTSAQVESNADTALITTSGIARVAGTQVDATPIYRTVATVTADTTETWQEHGVFTKATGTTLLDRSLISPTVAVVNLDQVQFTYEVTTSAEA